MAKRNLNSTKGTLRTGKKAKKAPTKENISDLSEEVKSIQPQAEKLLKSKAGAEEDLVKMASLYYESIHHKESQLFSTRQKSQLENLKLLSKANKDFPTETSLTSADKFLFQNTEGENSIDFSAGVGKDFLSYVMTWKLLRGKFRPRLLNLVDENTEELVKKVTRDCFNKLQASIKDFEGLPKQRESFISVNKPTILKLIKDLGVLRGIGPATASALLSMMCPELPFMSDEGLFHMLNKDPTKYDLKTYSEYLDFVDAQAKKLSSTETNLQFGKIPLPFLLERSWFSKKILEK